MKRFVLLFLSLIFSVLILLLYPVAAAIKPFLPFTDYLLGSTKPITYLFLLGNDTEMRANGGFAGSYSKINLNFPDFTVNFQDIYVPNGQLSGHVTPPDPIQKAFGHGTWELANADWEPDFPTSAQTLRWFFDKGGETNPDILGIINLSTIKKILNIVGPFPVSHYSATITPENVYLFLQGKAELNFFPGSTQKKDALTAVGSSLLKKVKSLSLFKKLQIAHILYQDLHHQNIVINSLNPDFQKLLSHQNLSGEMTSSAYDTYSLIETNLGSNKANQYVTRQTIHSITSSGNSLKHEVSLTFTNSSPSENPDPPLHYGGNYIAYLRFYVPYSASYITIFPETPDASVSAKFGLTEVGFWNTVRAGGQSKVTLSYLLPLSNPKDYSLAILKQHGMVTSPQEINLFGRTLSTPLETSYFYP